MAEVDTKGMATHPRILPMRFSTIERGPLKKIEGIIVHQTDTLDERGVFTNYRRAGAFGAHFLIAKDGRVWQTASLLQRTNHIGPLKPRCILEMACRPAELKLLQTALKEPRPKLSHSIEMTKSFPLRYPSNIDSVGIEIVGKASLPTGKTVPSGLSDDARRRFIDEHSVFEPVTAAQQASLQWLIDFLRQQFQIASAETYRHPTVSWKNRTEASTAQWR